MYLLIIAMLAIPEYVQENIEAYFDAVVTPVH